KLRDQMKVELKKLQREVGTTFLYITHDQSEALVMSDKIVVMNQGRLEQLDTPLNCYHQPATPFVAGFLGESNRWQGKLVQAGSDSASVELETGLVVKGKPVGTLKPGAPVQVFVRSEAVRLDPERRETNHVQGRITSAMFDGSAIRLLVRALLGTREGEITVALPERPEYRTLATGDSVALGWPAEACRCFAGGET
ncbi:MAG: ABC transporter ATP-binding protein, partial [Deltaproteobacteria bacterium]|nr:ABC transporter ATP-binding protein [Deltaproteobacteria bacterium]